MGVRHFDADKDLYVGGGLVIRQRNVVQMRPVSLDVGPVDGGTRNVEIWYCFRLIDAKTRDAVGRQQLKIDSASDDNRIAAVEGSCQCSPLRSL